MLFTNYVTSGFQNSIGQNIFIIEFIDKASPDYFIQIYSLCWVTWWLHLSPFLDPALCIVPRWRLLHQMFHPQRGVLPLCLSLLYIKSHPSPYTSLSVPSQMTHSRRREQCEGQLHSTFQKYRSVLLIFGMKNGGCPHCMRGVYMCVGHFDNWWELIYNYPLQGREEEEVQLRSMWIEDPSHQSSMIWCDLIQIEMFLCFIRTTQCALIVDFRDQLLPTGSWLLIYSFAFTIVRLLVLLYYHISIEVLNCRLHATWQSVVKQLTVAACCLSCIHGNCSLRVARSRTVRNFYVRTTNC